MAKVWSALNDRVCPRWLIGSFDNPIRRVIHHPRAILAGLVREGQTVVDIGCGIGYFTIPLAQLVGPEGHVVAVDLQQAMLEGVRRRAERAGVADRIRFHRATRGEIGVPGPADLVLAFWMVHEVRDKGSFFGQVRALLAPEGRLFLVEPKIHVSAPAFQRTAQEARTAGLEPVAAPRVGMSRALLFRSGSEPASASAL